MTEFETIQNKPRDKRTPIEQCIVDAARLEDERDGDYTQMEMAVKELEQYKTFYDLASQKKVLTAAMDNIIAYRLGLVGLKLIRNGNEKIGDEIDRGLVLRRLLEEAGFGLVRLG